MTDLATSFRDILKGLQVVIGIVVTQDRHREPLLAKIFHHLSRTIQRWEKLVANWRNGTLPKPRTRVPRASARRTAPALPSGQSWLIRNVDHYNARAHASQLEHFLRSDECVAFLAAVPRAARILRPLTKSLGILMPGASPPPPISKRPRPHKHRWLALPPRPTPAPVNRAPPNFFPPDSVKIH